MRTEGRLVLLRFANRRHCVVFLFFEGSSNVFGQSGLRTSAGNAPSKVARDVDRQNGIDADGVRALVKEARQVIIAARSALN